MHIMSRHSLKAKALALLAQREYTRAELEKKLLGWLQRQNTNMQDHAFGEDHDCKQQVTLLLNDLQYRGILSNERALDSLLNQKASRLGSLRIKQVLLNKGVDVRSVQSALAQLKDTEFERACATWQRKFSIAPLDAVTYNKQARFLSYRGFSADIVKKVLAHMKTTLTS